MLLRLLIVLVVVGAIGAAGYGMIPKTAAPSAPASNVEGVATGFDQYGYNDTARLFNGTGSSWCQAKGLDPNCMGIYSPDKLVMKWNAQWDRGNAENWANPPYKAWTDNEWNGKKAGGSGAIWHYKIAWNGPCTDGETLQNGGYCIWGQFVVLMDQGIDPSLGPVHTWFSKATPNGYGASNKP